MVFIIDDIIAFCLAIPFGGWIAAGVISIIATVFGTWALSGIKDQLALLAVMFFGIYVLVLVARSAIPALFQSEAARRNPVFLTLALALFALALIAFGVSQNFASVAFAPAHSFSLWKP